VAVLNLVFNIYPIYVFVGFWFGCKFPDILERLIPAIATFNAIYGLAFVGILNKWCEVLIPGTQVAVFGQPGGSMVSLLGLIILGNVVHFTTKRNAGRGAPR
ncbi:MAG: hypothetical protein Q8K78_13080, partial [Planctomycetaceae bacterium]|nr:hypothetical protein [Planctomycetaceae bacterium]